MQASSVASAQSIGIRSHQNYCLGVVRQRILLAGQRSACRDIRSSQAALVVQPHARYRSTTHLGNYRACSIDYCSGITDERAAVKHVSRIHVVQGSPHRCWLQSLPNTLVSADCCFVAVKRGKPFRDTVTVRHQLHPDQFEVGDRDRRHWLLRVAERELNTLVVESVRSPRSTLLALSTDILAPAKSSLVHAASVKDATQLRSDQSQIRSGCRWR